MQPNSCPGITDKSDVNPSHEVFALRNWLLQVVEDYTSLARRMSKFEGGWPANVFAYQEGEIVHVIVGNFPEANISYLPSTAEVKAALL